MYKRFKEACQNLDIRTVDFFFAKEVFELVKNTQQLFNDDKSLQYDSHSHTGGNLLTNRVNSKDTRLRGYDSVNNISHSGLDRESHYYMYDSDNLFSNNNSSATILFHILMLLMSKYAYGHSCIKIADIADEIFFDSDDKDQPKAGYKFVNHSQIVSILDSLDYKGLPIYYAKEFDSLYVKRLWQYENEIADFIDQKTIKESFLDKNIKQVVGKLFEPTGETDWQKQAVINSFSYNFSIISGGPGTGKTTTVAKLLLAMQMLNDKSQKIALLAPTGKAAQRMAESLKNTLGSVILSGLTTESIVHLQNLEAQTIHRFLGLRPDSNFIKYGDKTKAPFDVIIVDEASMLDINIFIKLIRAVGENTRLVLLGDINQLPSVEAGSLLANFTASYNSDGVSKFTTKLIKNYRSQQNINNLASDVLLGEVDLAKHQNENISFHDFKEIDKQLRIYTNKYKELESLASYKEALQRLNKFRILVANKNLEIGTDRLNQKIEQLLGKPKNTNYKARPIMITQNSYSLGLFNGDVGIIWPDNSGVLRAYFDGKEDRAFSLNMLPQYESVYAMTIHKTQGSEFEEIAIILPPEDNKALTKQLLYTGITRAKTKLDIIANIEVFDKVIKKNQQRNSNISRLITSATK